MKSQNRRKTAFSGQRTAYRVSGRMYSPVLVYAIFIAVFILAGPAFGQGRLGFMVKPMKMEFSARAGQTVEKVLELRNTTTAASIIDLKLVELTQNENGHWRSIEEGEDVDRAGLYSCKDWVNLSGVDSVEVGPLTMATVTVKVRPPAGSRGFYLAALLASTRPTTRGAVTRERITIPVSFRFLIPLLVDLQGRPMRQKIELSDVGMTFREQSQTEPAATLVSMSIENNGRTYSRLAGSVMIKKLSAGHWRKVTIAEFKEVSIIPGVKLNLKSDIGRSLPSGKYRLTGQLYVDGRRTKPLEKEIDFVGDPSVTRLAVDAALELPPIVSITSIPGATRTTVLRVDNTSEEGVEIGTAALMPPSLKNIALGELKGDELVCAEWVKITPEKFTLRGGGRQNIRIITRMPRAEQMQANYYALLGLRATYPDGSSAGETTTLLNVGNKQVEAKPAIQPMKLALAAGEEANKYVVAGRFGNVGNVHITPRCSATITTALGGTVARILLAGKLGLMLPLEARDFSGVVDFSGVDAGTYSLNAILEYAAGETVATAIPIRVSVEDGRRVVEIIE